MPTSDFQQTLTWFNNQATQFKNHAGDDAPLIERKQRHTMRVLDHVHEILKESGASDTLAQAVEMATLLHDIGRFPQIVDRETLDDKEGYNHAEEGARIINETHLLDNFSPDMRGVILSTIKYHNRAVLPENLGNDARLALEILRDADKLDAIRNNLKYLNPNAPHGKALKSGLTWHDTEVSPEVMELAMQRQLIPFETINWSNDFILFLCCWLYDLHFTYTFNHLKQSGNFEALLAKLPDTAQCTEAKKQLREDLDWIIAKT